MADLKLALLVSESDVAEAAGAALRERYDFVSVSDADVVVALGGDGFLLHTLHEALLASTPKPVFGMNRGTVGFMMNEFDELGLVERVAAARVFDLHPLLMTAETITGETVTSPAINEVSLLRETRQAAKIEIAIDGKVRMEELICDGLLARTPLSPFRPRRWRGALLPQASVIEFRIREARKRPVSAVADQREVRDVDVVRIITDKSIRLQLMFDPGYALDDRIVAEQFAS